MTVSPLRSGDPQRLGGYRLLSRLGEGGMGWVFLGESSAGTQVAVKVVRPELASDPAFRARFRSEVQRARQVPPFCTAEVIDADADHDPPYMVVEYVPGSTLADIVVEKGRLSGGELHSLAIGVTVALVAIHDAGVVHRDLKPANVLFALGAPKVIDFGVAKTLDATDHQTELGQVFGTVAYMGPERLLGPATEHADTAGDIFAWGAVVTYAATGGVPFPPDTLIGAAAGVPLPAPDLAGLPEPLRGLVRRALHEDPRRRPSAHELLEQLIKKGAPGSTSVPETRPALQRAAAAVWNTAAMPSAPADIGAPVTRNARPRRRTLAVAAAVLLAAAAAFPVFRPAAPAGPTAAASAQPDLSSRADDKASRAGRGDRCTLDGPLDLTASEPAAFTCPAARVAGDRDIQARLALTAPGACAAIRMQTTGTDAYRITICADRATMDTERGTDVRTITLSTLHPAAWHRIAVSVSGLSIAVTLDGEIAFNRPRLTSPTRGAVSLGSIPDPARPAAAGQVTFADVVIASA